MSRPNILRIKNIILIAVAGATLAACEPHVGGKMSGGFTVMEKEYFSTFEACKKRAFKGAKAVGPVKNTYENADPWTIALVTHDATCMVFACIGKGENIRYVKAEQLERGKCE